MAVPDPVTISTDKTSGSQPVEVEAGYDGQLSGAGYGLAAPDVKAKETIDRSPSGGPDPAGDEPGTKMYGYDVPAGSQLLLTRLENVDTPQDPTDLDIYVYLDANDDGEFTLDEIVDFSASATSEEQVTMLEPEAGTYGIEVVGFDVKTPVSVYDLVTAVIADPTADQAGDAASITVGGDPKTVAPGDKPELDLLWSNVNAKGRYFGLMTYHEGATPSAGNRIDQSVVELTQTADSPAPQPPGGPGGGTTPPPTTPPPGGQPKPTKLRLNLTSARLKGRTLTLRLRSNRRVKVRTTVRRNGRKVASAPSRTVRTTTRVLRVRLNRKLRRGRTYTVRIAAYSGRRLADADSVRLRLRR